MMWTRGAVSTERLVLSIGIVLFVVLLGFYAFEGLIYAQLVTIPSSSTPVYLEFLQSIAGVVPLLLLLLVGFSVRRATGRPGTLLFAFVLVEVVGLALTLSAIYLLNFNAPSTIFLAIGVLYLASGICSAVGVFLLLLLALPPRPHAPLPSATASPTPALPPSP